MPPEPKDEPTTSLGWGRERSAVPGPPAHSSWSREVWTHSPVGTGASCGLLRSLSHLAATKLLCAWSPI